MNRSHHCPAYSKLCEFVTGKRAAGVQRNFAAPIRRSLQRRCGACNRSIRNTEPNHLCLNIRLPCPHGQCAYFQCQSPGSTQRLRTIARDDLLDPVSRSVQGYGQSTGQIPSTDDCNP